MPEREEANFKVTDRRKYNPDGSPREAGESQTPPSVAEDRAQTPTSVAEDRAQTPPSVADDQAQSPEAAASNVVTFPGESARKAPEPPTIEPVASETKATEPAQTDSQAAASRAEPVQTADQAAAAHAERAYNQARGPQSSRLPDASFLSLANMLAVEAAMHLGLIQTPGEEPPPPDLEAARHLIDMLGILQAKTRGNLTNEEDNLLENLLADLRMQFVAITRGR